MKTRITLLLAVALILSLFSCSKKDKDSGSSLKVAIVGTWVEQVAYVESYLNGQLQDREEVKNEDDDIVRLKFNADQTVQATVTSNDGDEEQATGTYSISGNTLTINSLDIDTDIDDEDATGDDGKTVVQCQINGSQMVWVQEAEVTSTTSDDKGKVRLEVHFTKE